VEDAPRFSLIVSVGGAEQTAAGFITGFSLLARKQEGKIKIFSKDTYLPL
jgi:hypothetical protein